MAVRAMNGSAILRCCTASPPIAAIRCCVHQYKAVHFHRGGQSTKLGFPLSILQRSYNKVSNVGDRIVAIRKYSVQSLVDMVVEELESLRKRGRVRASNKYEVYKFIYLLRDLLSSVVAYVVISFL